MDFCNIPNTGYQSQYRDQYQDHYNFLIFFIVIIIIIIIIAIIWVLISGTNPQAPGLSPGLSKQTYNQKVASTQGSSSNGNVTIRNGQSYKDAISCRAGPTRYWGNIPGIDEKGCNCYAPFWGTSCTRESYSDKYTPMGNIPLNQINSGQMDMVTTNRLSFPFSGNTVSGSQTICTDLCDADSNCTGVYWIGPDPPNMGTTTAQGQCYLISGDITLDNRAKSSIDPTKDSNLYIKSNQTRKIVYPDRVFLWTGSMPTSWSDDHLWNNNTRMITMYEDTQYKLPFFPQGARNDGNLTGIYSNGKISDTNINTIINQTNNPNFYISEVGQPLAIPNDWSISSGIWVIYISLESMGCDSSEI